MPGGQATQKESLASQPGAHCIKTIDIANVKVFHLANSCSFFHRAAAWDELGDLPVNPEIEKKLRLDFILQSRNN